MSYNDLFLVFIGITIAGIAALVGAWWTVQRMEDPEYVPDGDPNSFCYVIDFYLAISGVIMFILGVSGMCILGIGLMVERM